MFHENTTRTKGTLHEDIRTFVIAACSFLLRMIFWIKFLQYIKTHSLTFFWADKCTQLYKTQRLKSTLYQF